MDLEARVLGPLQLTLDGVDITPSAIRQQALLAALLLHHGQTVPLPALTTDIWGTDPPATPREQIQTHVHRIRRQFDKTAGHGTGRRLLTWAQDGYALHLPADHIDLSRFVTAVDKARVHLTEDRPAVAHTLLTDALAIWRGPALAGLATGTGLTPHIQRLDDLRTEALGLRITADLRTGHAARTIPELRALVTEHPHDETFHAHLATALHRTDRTAEALRVLERYGAALEAAHGTGLPPRLQVLHAAIKNDATPPTTPAPPITTATPRPATTQAPPPPVKSPPPNRSAPDPHQNSVRFTVLGPVRAWRGATPLATGSPQQRTLLATLLLRGGRTTTAAELVDALWGEEPPHAALAALRTYASRIRKALGADADLLVAESGGYALRGSRNQPLDLDLDHAERYAAEAENARAAGDRCAARDLLNSALALWDGEPLANLTGPYADNQRTRLEEWHLSLLETRLELDLDLGNHTEAVPELTALTAAHPLRERLRELLMLALYRSGRQAEALAVFADTRRLLADELGVDPSPTLAALHQRILTADPELGLPAPPNTDEPPPVIPLQLPATVPDFVVPEATLAQLGEQLISAQSPSTTVSAISGMAGIGKTTLAVHVAHLVRDHFPDGQLYVDLQATHAPTAPEAVLGSFLRALGTPETHIPDGVHERAARYRALLADRRVLVLLDNARDAAQVRPLLPGTNGSAALVTSRSHLVGLDGAQFVDLDVMPPDQALTLFTRIVGEQRVATEVEAARNVAHACGYLPLAIRIAAARLAARRTWTVSVLAAKLADERHRLDELRTGDLAVASTLELTYRRLTPRQAQAFRLLGLADGPDISLPAAASLLDTDAHADSDSDSDSDKANSTDATEELLESLVDTSLLESAAPGHYRFHELVRLYARSRAGRDEPPPAREAARTRLLHHYLATATDAHQLKCPGDRLLDHLTPATRPGTVFPSRSAALDWVFTQGSNLLAAARQAAAPGRSPHELRPATDLLLLTQDLLSSAVLLPQYEQTAHTLAEAAQEAGDTPTEARARLLLSRARARLGRFREAEIQSRAARTLGQLADDPVVRGRALNLRGVEALTAHRLTAALTYFTQALDAFRHDDDRYGEAAALAHQSRALLGLGRKREALAAADRALRHYRALGASVRLAHGLYTTGVTLAAAGRPDAARSRYAEALALFHEERQSLWAGLTLYRLAEALLEAGQPREAARHAEDALSTLRINGGTWRRATVLVTLGHALRAAGRPERAHVTWEEALRLFTTLRAPEADDVRVLLGLPAPRTPAAARLP
ncbi:BTAD domain-containing putative transcriptional regulator [Streptomyces sp. NPDC039022]|uniref:AfsR/SARP family transcriptional regulator n=1 Tax=Streptomyces sp. NPDC039022 TaxID=3157091 RepID=UPI00340923B4